MICNNNVHRWILYLKKKIVFDLFLSLTVTVVLLLNLQDIAHAASGWIWNRKGDTSQSRSSDTHSETQASSAKPEALWETWVASCLITEGL